MHTIGKLLAALLCAVGIQSQAQDKPLLVPVVPAYTSFAYYDRGWIQWLPDHPLYESIEAQITSRPESPRPFVRVFFSARDGNKSQVFYYNDAELASNWRVGQAFHRDIELSVDGEPGAPRSLRVRFRDKDDRPVEWSVRFDSGQKLTGFGTGLRQSVGHSRDLVYMLPLRGPGAVTNDARLQIGDATYRVTPMIGPGGGPLFRYGQGAGYTDGEYVTILNLGRFAIAATPEGVRLADRDFRWVAQAEDRTTYRAATGLSSTRADRVEFDLGPNGGVREYRHYSGERVLRLAFEPSIPPLPELRSGQRLGFQLAWDAQVLVRGTLEVERDGDATALAWKPTEPTWLAERPLRSEFRATGASSLELRLVRP